MTAFLGGILGRLLKFVYDIVSTTGLETETISYYAIAVIITTIIFKLFLLPMNLSQTKSTQKMSEIQPLMQEIHKLNKGSYSSFTKIIIINLLVDVYFY